MMHTVVSRLTGPGGRFEIVEEEVRGNRMPVMRNRDRRIGDLVAASRQWGDRDYLVTADRRISFAEHADAVAALATALRDDYGVRKGDRVAVLAANSPEWVVTFWATQCLGAITVGLNSWWTPTEITYGVDLTAPRVIVADARRAELLARADVSGFELLTIEDDVPRIVAERSGSELPSADVDEDDPAVILFTSGTSGHPKGALHSHRNVLAVVDYHRYSDALVAAMHQRSYDDSVPSDNRYLLASPLFHIASLHNLAIPRLATGSAVVMTQGAFDVDKVFALIEQEKVTNWGAVPTMAARMLEHEDPDRYDLSSLTAFALASAPSSPALKQRLREKFPFAGQALVDSYGLTECSTAVAVATAPELEAFPGTLGSPIITVSLEIRDPFGERVPDGDEGEVCVRSPYVMLGYWEDPEATDASITSDGWLRTGDYGTIENGRLRLTGRRSDLILRGGENVYPTEIEQRLDEHPDVVESAVIGVDHEDLGQEVAAVVVLRPGSAITEDELRAFCAERLAYYKVPTVWRITRDLLPRNATGKIIRRSITV
ncbi:MULTISPECIES: class I adenylate-forming enzyme family protein [unclassified Rhodococcus (in: high G+C Gram-positive bacteria)]|uniref:class I adenylate-forming enzyme family protein n=1 Tax=unclassified Rhodococcus (in: high G+C Gram-positive bacteria) TaxID=192944 RepID=UPI00233F42A7|nr:MULTISPECIES: class I adenylate-forming enzyme family protein [unclassified Rhodococcus (in: high G+C Gram-positive bacteria)]MDC3724113.1 acyl--CoA ligase [Rhodococcus sp. Rp3]WSE25245.1 class I adenylate-forming enzyme family protein [Rhodococcus sp. PD04]